MTHPRSAPRAGRGPGMRHRRAITLADREEYSRQLAELAARGLNATEIARENGITSEAARMALHRRGYRLMYVLPCNTPAEPHSGATEGRNGLAHIREPENVSGPVVAISGEAR